MAKSKGKTASQIVSESRQELVDQLIQKMKDGVSPVREMCEKEEIRFTSGPVWIPSYTATDQKSKDKCNKNDGKSG